MTSPSPFSPAEIQAWMAEHVRVAQEQAWNEGQEVGYEIGHDQGRGYWFSTEPTNPYTQGDKHA